MTRLSRSLAAVVIAAAGSVCLADEEVPPALDFTVETIDGDEVELNKYLGKVVLVVNVASKCGLTPQYEQLQALHEQYSDEGLAILGFPANEFGKQEPGTNLEIKEFCTSKYDVSFDMFAKVIVKGAGQCELYQYLTDDDENPIKWNFEKFLINRKGEVVARFEPPIKPDSERVVSAIEAELQK